MQSVLRSVGGLTMHDGLSKRGRIAASVLMMTLVFTMSAVAAPDATATFSPGDILVSLSNGTVQWWSSNLTLKKVLDSANGGQAKGMAFGPDGSLYVTHW